MKVRFFRYSAWDALPALCVAGLVCLLGFSFLYCQTMPWWALAGCFLATSAGYWWNLQCLSHNFIHNPFFAWGWLNRAFSVLETVALGVPHVFYHHYHMKHHRGDNDKKGPTGTTKDWSSIYRHSQDDQAEPFWRYILLGYFRVEMRPLLTVVWKHGRDEMLQATLESLVTAALWLGLAWLDWRFFLFFYVPSHYLGWMLSYAEGYFEHYGAQPGNQFANSVSSYNWVYNVLCFNNGYHQEHHWDPKKHWRHMPELHAEIKDDLVGNNTRTTRWPHFLVFLERFWWEREGSAAASMPVSFSQRQVSARQVAGSVQV